MSMFYCEWHGKSEDSDYVGYHHSLEICDDARNEILAQTEVPDTLPELYAMLEDLNRELGAIPWLLLRDEVLEQIEKLEHNSNHHK